MLNKVLLNGRLVKDVELQGTGEKQFAKVSLAVSRDFKTNGEYETDYINGIAFGPTATYMSKYMAKGSLVGIVGRLKVDSYTNKSGQQVYSTVVAIEQAYALSKVEGRTTAQGQAQAVANSYNEEINEDDLPF